MVGVVVIDTNSTLGWIVRVQRRPSNQLEATQRAGEGNCALDQSLRVKAEDAAGGERRRSVGKVVTSGHLQLQPMASSFSM